MGEYEPRDSRNVTLKQERAPGEPPRTGPQEAATRQPQAQRTELEQDESGEDAEQVREDAMEQDAEELDESLRSDRND